ncbi:hypothetical protein NC651_026884 [Populus alba x Populus x berolinensis]|nr:hypothetical protein NC651_026884 [Populus alba x Populus x berolinensis]
MDYEKHAKYISSPLRHCGCCPCLWIQMSGMQFWENKALQLRNLMQIRNMLQIMSLLEDTDSQDAAVSSKKLTELSDD